MPEPKLTKSAKTLLEYFRTFPAGDPITATHKELATALNCTTRSIRNALHQLEEIGEIRIESGKEEGKASTYFVNTPPETNVLLPAIISIGGKEPEKIHYPVDKINSLLFSKGFEKSGNYPISAEKHGSKKEITTILTLDFEELERDTALTFRKLTPFDKRVYLSAGALLEAGNKYISATQIYKAMGGKGRPAPNQIENIVNSCKKMMIYRLRIDNRQEAEAYNYPLFQNGYFFLFPFEIVENVTINGKLTDFCIHALKDELLLIEYARERKQVKSFTLEQWTLPFSMTEEHILIDDYFRKRISHMQRDKEKTGRYINKILFKTIYENLGIDTKRGATAIMRKKKSRTAPKFRQLLEHYKDTGIITGYTEGQDGFTIKL